MNTLTSIRSRLSMTQSELANALGQTQGNIGHYEAERQQIPVYVAKKLIQVAADKGLKLSLDDIYQSVSSRSEVE